MDVLLTYDIADTEGTGAGRLRRIAEICERYGQRVQFSVFEFRLSPTQLAHLIGEVEDIINHRKDSVILYRFKGSIEDSMTFLGRKPDRNFGEPWIV